MRTRILRIGKDVKDGGCWFCRAPWPPVALTLALSRRAGEGDLLFGVRALVGVCGIMDGGVGWVM